MEKTTILLSDRELKYAKKQFRSAALQVRLLWPTFVFIALLGGFIIWMEELLVGSLLMLLGIAGAIFFKRYSDQSNFVVRKEAVLKKGSIRMSDGGSKSTEGAYGLFLGKQGLQTPDGLELFFEDLVREYKGKKVSVKLAVCDCTIKEKSYQVYTPLRIEDDFCIDEAIDYHGPHFLVLPTLLLYWNLFLFMILFGIGAWIAFVISGIFPNEFLQNVIFFLLLISFFILGSWGYSKIFPDKRQERLRRLLAGNRDFV